MATSHLMISINWFGSYDLRGAYQAASSDFGAALYLCMGKRKHQRNKSLQYIGIGQDVRTRLRETHHKLKYVSRDREIWLGEISTAEPSGRRLKVTPATLDYAEWAYARFFDLPLNEKKSTGLPKRSFTVLNRWWHTDYERSRVQRPHRDWPDLIDYPGDDLPVRKVWFGGRQEKLLPPEYVRPGLPPLRGLSSPLVEELSNEDRAINLT
ncbi:hypothetical protein [Paracoccus aerius]|uniref:GIY-YIG nuclease family protein n=1 Tax=Paracoccus aerius TaxID=1915382 RepID=A0ABS1S9M1_9RHOB|nr:hypothetical protein [Paracoccus aerius]MBL3674407.1 hypothetical protein [Paracoccus aerius]